MQSALFSTGRGPVTGFSILPFAIAARPGYLRRMDIRWIPALPAALLSACAPPGAEGAAGKVVIQLALDPSGTCRAELGDSVFALPDDEAALSAALRSRASRARNATVLSDEHVPYKCFGRAIFLAQRAGFERVGFAAEPPPDMPER